MAQPASALPQDDRRPTSLASPQVVHTGTAPTGYEVTFRIRDPEATRMRIKGEWFFSAASDSSPTTSAGRLPSQWRPGDFPLAHPSATGANWPVADLVKNEKSGVWSFTTPLPSGVFTYQLYRNCDATAPALAGCTPMADPANPPWNKSGSIEPTSQVYVPSDPRFGTEDYSWQAPAPRGHRGTLTNVTYPSPLSTSPPGSHDLVVYTPPGYDPDRATRYPLLVLNHGGGGNEIDWSTQGAMAQIVDNLIREKRIQPLVIANTRAGGISGGTPGYATDVLDSVIPYMEAHYNVAAEPRGQGYAGLSAGGARGNELLFNHTARLGYVGIWSCCNSGIRPPGDPVYDNPALKELIGLHIAVGTQDPIAPFAQDEMAGLTQAGVPFTSYAVNGGHNWHFWRGALRDYLTRVAFRTTTTELHARPTAVGVVLRARVAPATDQPAEPTGRVRFLVNGTPYGAPRALHHGTATLIVPASALPPGPVTYEARYDGDRFYAGSSTADS